MISDISYLGTVIRVDSATVEVEVSDDIPSSTPIINGRLYKIGQVGTFVKMPMGNITTYGIVSSVSNTPTKVDESLVKQMVGSRFLSVQLVGEKIGNDEFEKGVGTYPTINDEVHLVVEKDLLDIYGTKNSGSIEIGKHSSSDNLSVYVDLHKLILRHCGILGSTGSGKSNSTVSVLKAILEGYAGSRVVLIDPHGEYPSAFPEATVFKIDSESNPLHIPFWLMNFDELAYFLVGAKPKDDQRIEHRRLREMITELKIEALESISIDVDPRFITADSPIPFSVRKLWHEINWWLNATFEKTVKDDQTKENACYSISPEESCGDPETLIPASFKPYVMTNSAPYKSKHIEFYSYEKRLLSRLKDTRFDFMFNPGAYLASSSSKDLHHLLNAWIGSKHQLAILDLSGVPFEVLDISIGLITRFIYDSMFWGRDESYTGKQRPLLFAYEEAHTYLNKNENNSYSKAAVERIFKEGRKFGVGALVISQRPSEISETILSQIGTFISLRLTNSGDQSIIKSSAPDNLNSLMDLLPSLRIGEAVVVGESIKIPSRIRLRLNNPRPTSEDPDLVKCWEGAHETSEDNYKIVVKSIREKKLPLAKKE